MFCYLDWLGLMAFLLVVEVDVVETLRQEFRQETLGTLREQAGWRDPALQTRHWDEEGREHCLLLTWSGPEQGWLEDD